MACAIRFIAASPVARPRLRSRRFAHRTRVGVRASVGDEAKANDGSDKTAFFCDDTGVCSSADEEDASDTSRGLLGPDPIFAQTMLRVKDPKASRAFYEGKLGMKYLTFLDFPDLDFSLYFYAYTDVDTPDDSAPQPERAQWLFKQRFPTMELTHNYGTESDPAFEGYANGNSDPGKGFGHVGLIVDDLEGATARLEAADVPVVRKAGPFKDVGSIAFVSDPDGYWVELIQRAK